MLRPEPAQDQGDAIAPAELVELAQAEGRRGIEALHHAEVEEEVAHAGLNDQVAAGLHEPAREGEEEVALQTERAAETSVLLEDSGVLQRALLVGAMARDGQVVADVGGAAVTVGEEERRHEQAEDYAGDDPLRGDQDEDGHDQGMLAEREPEERVPHPLAEERDAEIDQQAGEDGPREVKEQTNAEDGDARAESSGPHARGATRRARAGVQEAPAHRDVADHAAAQTGDETGQAAGAELAIEIDLALRRQLEPRCVEE